MNKYLFSTEDIDFHYIFSDNDMEAQDILKRYLRSYEDDTHYGIVIKTINLIKVWYDVNGNVEKGYRYSITGE